MLFTIAAYFNGLVVVLSFLVFIVISLPIYVWRYFLEYIAVPVFHSSRLGDPVSPVSTVFCTEFLTNHPPRCVIVTNFVMEGEMPFAEVMREVRTKWIDGEGSAKMYPELKQYPKTFSGFLWWHKDKNFNLENHLHQHKISPGDEAASESWICEKIESLLNTPFVPNRSPWEIHVVENYKGALGQKKNKPLTVFIIRFHHGLADGFSMLHAVIEGLFGSSLDTLAMAKPSKSSLSSATSATLTKNNAANKSVSSNWLKFCAKAVYDVGTFANLVLLRPRTPWHVPDNEKRWHQIYARSQLIPIERVKKVKDKFGVSFTAVIFACIAAGVSKSIHGDSQKRRKGHQRVEAMATMTVLPLPGHPKKLTNHAAPALFDLLTAPDVDPVTRLKACEKGLHAAKDSTVPFFAILSTNLVGRHLAIAQKLLLTNRAIPMGLSNFPGPGKEIEWNGRKGLSADFIAGSLNGVAGAGFMVLSYRNQIRIACSVEKAIMERPDLEHLIQAICNELQVYENM